MGTTQGPAAPPAHTGGAQHLRLLEDILEGADAARLRRNTEDFSRSGPLSPRLLVYLLLFAVVDAGRRGYRLLLESYWAHARAASLDLPCPQPVSAAAFCLARRKLRPAGVRDLVWRAAERFERQWGASHRWRGRRVFAVDGSRVSLQRSDELWERYGAATGAGCPQATLSTLFDVVSKVPHDVCVAPFGADERRLLLQEHLDHLSKGDLLVLDRGYPSFEVLCHLLARGVDFAMRVRLRSGFPAVADFVRSGQRNAWIEISVPKEYRVRDMPGVRVRAVRIDGPGGEPVAVLTSLPLAGFGWRVIQELYALRWGIESYYRVVKGDYLGQRQYHAKTALGIEQEVYAHALFISLTRHLMAAASQRHDVPYRHLSEKNALMAVADELTRLVLLRHRRQRARLLEAILERIARNLTPHRPGRSYPRRSFRPWPRWHANGKRGGKQLA